MDSPAETPIPLYETLTPLYIPSPIPTPNQSPPSYSFDPYTVLRNEISLSSLTSTPMDSAAPDFFCLDVGGALEEEREPKTPSGAAEPDTLTPKTEPEPRLEGSWFRGNSRYRSPMLQLHKEIVDFCDFLSPTLEEEAARNTAVKCVVDVIKYIWPNCKVEIFGSFRTGLYLPTSDIDVVILGSGVKKPQTGLHALSRALSQKGIAKKIQVIAKARVPIIKFVEKQSGVSFDLSFDAFNGPKAAEFIEDALSKWPALRPLCLILKVFLQQRELNEVYSGGIGSYALLVMLMAVLKNHRECQTASENNLGVLLVHFFDIYGRKLNTTDVGISCKGAATFFSKHKKGFMNKGRPFLIAIEDPQAPENDVGKNSFNYFQIKSAFSMAFSTLTNPKTILSLGPERSILGTIIRPDPVLLERKGGCNGKMNFNSLLPGAGEPIPSHYNEHQEILGNWQLDDCDEEELPRGGGITEDGGTLPSGKKRKSSSKAKSGKKKENGVAGKHHNEEYGSRKERKKQRPRNNHDDANGHYAGGSPWQR